MQFTVITLNWCEPNIFIVCYQSAFCWWQSELWKYCHIKHDLGKFCNNGSSWGPIVLWAVKPNQFSAEPVVSYWFWSLPLSQKIQEIRSSKLSASSVKVVTTSKLIWIRISLSYITLFLCSDFDTICLCVSVWAQTVIRPALNGPTIRMTQWRVFRVKTNDVWTVMSPSATCVKMDSTSLVPFANLYRIIVNWIIVWISAPRVRTLVSLNNVDRSGHFIWNINFNVTIQICFSNPLRET